MGENIDPARTPSLASLRALHSIIGQSLEEIESVYTPAGVDFPNLDKPLDRNSPSEKLIYDPIVIEASKRIIAAAGQLTSTVQIPGFAVVETALHYELSACLGIFETTHTAELLREAGPNGMHASIIAQRTGVDQIRISHVLRLLASHHFLREVSFDVFGLNRPSSVLDTGKNFDDIKAQPGSKYRDTDGVAAIVAVATDETFKSSSHLADASYHLPELRDNARNPSMAAFGSAFGSPGTHIFAWLGQEHNDWKSPVTPQMRMERFAKAMHGMNIFTGNLVNAFDWSSLSPGSTIVDVGGGIGSACMLLAEKVVTNGSAAKLNIIVQDRKEVVETGADVWKKELPAIYKTGAISFQAHDFFQPQPVKGASVYILRTVLHDWPNEECKNILRNIRTSASEDSKLVIGDFILSLACDDMLGPNLQKHKDIVVEGRSPVPRPLLPNLGKASAVAYSSDIMMHAVLNAQERTLPEHIELCLSAGWKAERVVMAKESHFGYLIAAPTAVP